MTNTTYPLSAADNELISNATLAEAARELAAQPQGDAPPFTSPGIIAAAFLIARDALEACAVQLEQAKARPSPLKNVAETVEQICAVAHDMGRQLGEARQVVPAHELRKGDIFTYVGAFVLYIAESDAEADPTFEGRVTLKHSRDGQRIGSGCRLEADRPVTVWRMDKQPVPQLGEYEGGA